MVRFLGKTFNLTSQAEFTNTLLPSPYENYNDVSEGEWYEAQLSAKGVDEAGEEVTVFWIITFQKGNEQEIDVD